MEVAVIYTKRKPESEPMASSLYQLVKSNGLVCSCMSLEEVLASDRISCDLLVVLGGDGTILSAMHRLEEPETPVLAVSYGRGGFLATVSPSEALEALTKYLTGSYYLERQMRIAVEVNGERIGDVINDIYISHSQPGKTIEYDISVDGAEFANVVADGLIVATPLGSTAYAMSCGGPAVDDSVDCFVLTPVCAITNMKPLVVSSQRVIGVKIDKFEFNALIDGSVRRVFEKGEVTLRRSEKSVVFVRTNPLNWFEKRVKKRIGEASIRP